MEPFLTSKRANLLLAISIPFIAWFVQWGLWSYINPFAWLTFYPAVFFSARFGGFIAGLISTVLSVFIVWFFFFQPHHSLQIENTNNLLTTLVFGFMGYLISDLQEKLKKVNKRISNNLNTTRKVEEKEDFFNEKSLKNKNFEKNESFAYSHEDKSENVTIPSILIIDDQEDISEFIARNLSHEFLVSTATNGKEGFERAMVIKPDLIITDILMPIMNDVELVTKLHETPELTDIPILILTAVIDEPLKYSLLKEKVHDFINKPFSIDELKYKVEDLIKQNKKHKRQLFEAENRYKNALDNMLEGCQILNKEWEYLYINPAAEKHNKRSNTELIGKKYMDVWPGIEETHVFKVIEDCLKNKNNHYFENEFIFPDGTPGWFELSIYSVPEGVFILSEDITLKKINEIKIKKSESELKKAHKIAGLGYWTWYIHENKLEWSDEMYPIFGIDKNTFTGKLDEVISNTIHPDDREKVQKLNLSVMESGIAIPTEYRVIWPDNSIRYIWAEGGELIRDNSNKPVVLKGIVQDITQRKLAEIAQEKLNESENRFRKIFEDGPFGMVITNINFQFVSANASFCSMMGYTEEELTSKTIVDITHPDYIEENVANIKKIINGDIKVYKTEKKFICKDLRVIWASCTITIHRTQEGKFIHLIGMVEDITVRKQAEEQIRKLGQHYQALIEKAPDGILLINAEGNIKYASPSARKLFGYSLTEQITANGAEFTHPDDLPLVLSELEKLLHDSTYIPTLQYRFMDISKNWRWIESTFTNMLNDSSVESIIINFRDITARRNDEEKLRESEITFASMFQKSPVTIMLSIPYEGTILDVNDSFLKNMEYRRDEVIGSTPLELGLFDNPIEIEKLVAVLKENNSVFAYECRFRTKSGKTLVGLVSIVFIKIYGRTCQLSTVIDITDRKKTEQALMESEEIFRHFMENSPIYVFFKDENIRAVKLSNNFEHLLDRPLNEILGKTMDELFPSDLAKSMIADDKRILNNQELIIVDEELNGRFYTTIKFPIIIDGKARYLAGYTIDITERKLSENKIKAQLYELQRWNEATLDREERILELKHEVNELLAQTGKPIRYSISSSELNKEQSDNLKPPLLHSK